MARTGQIRGRRGIIGGYWGGYNSLSSSPTPKALPGKVENLTPPANGKNAPDGAPPAQTEGQSSSAPRAAALAFFFCPSSSPAACPACRISSRPARPDVRTARPMTTPARRSRSRSHCPPPAPGRISTASTAPDDPASSTPPPPAQRPQPASLARPHSASASSQRRHRGRTSRASAAHLPPPAIAAACRMIHPAAPRKTAILPRRRRGQILHLTG